MSREELRRLIADDAYAASFQTMGQYRSALLKAVDSAQDVARAPEGEELTDAQKHILAEQESLIHPATQVFFRAGLIACREYMARFVSHESPTIAASIRANWWPSLGQDFGAPRKLEWSEMTEGEYGEEGFRDKTAEEVSPTQEALPIALGFLQSLDPAYRRATIDMGMERSFTRAVAAPAAPAVAPYSAPQDFGSTIDRTLPAGILHQSAPAPAEQHPLRCDDSGQCGVGGYCEDCPARSERAEQQGDGGALTLEQYAEQNMLTLEEAADRWKPPEQPAARDYLDTLTAVLNAIGYTEEFAASHPDLKVSEGVKLFLAEQPSARVALSDAALECLRDVVSHHSNIVAGFAAQRFEAQNANDNNTVAYWNHEIAVACRMKKQAERAILAASAAQTGESK